MTRATHCSTTARAPAISSRRSAASMSTAYALNAGTGLPSRMRSTSRSSAPWSSSRNVRSPEFHHAASASAAVHCAWCAATASSRLELVRSPNARSPARRSSSRASCFIARITSRNPLNMCSSCVTCSAAPTLSDSAVAGPSAPRRTTAIEPIARGTARRTSISAIAPPPSAATSTDQRALAPPPIAHFTAHAPYCCDCRSAASACIAPSNAAVTARRSAAASVSPPTRSSTSTSDPRTAVCFDVDPPSTNSTA